MIEYLFLIIALLIYFRMLCDLSIANIPGTNVTYFTITVEFITALIFLIVFLYLKRKKK